MPPAVSILPESPLTRLGEGPLWHPLRRLLFWFDIAAGRIHWCAADGSGAGSHTLAVITSAAAWIDDRTLLVAAEDGFYRYGIDTCALSLLAPLEQDRSGNRSNDGRCDPWGRFWVGTMDKQAVRGRGALYILHGDLRLECVRDGLTIPNSIAFSPDRRRAYLADSAEQTIFVLSLDPRTGQVRGQDVFATSKGETAVPDGSVIDAEGCLWNAQWDGWRIVRYRPNGAIDRVIELPIQRPTCPAFGGADLHTLFVTSAREGLDADDLRDQPDAGGTFVIETKFAGLPEPSFHLI